MWFIAVPIDAADMRRRYNNRRDVMVALAVTAVILLAASPVGADGAIVTPRIVLSAYRGATGGDAWRGKVVMKTIATLTDGSRRGSRTTVTDLQSGHWMTHRVVGQTASAIGFDGQRVWTQGRSGVVEVQRGLAESFVMDSAYVSANQWWQPHFGGASVVVSGARKCGGSTCTVLAITPSGGSPFHAWFDTQSHLLVRIVHGAGARTVTDDISGYRAVDGVRVPYRRVINTGSAAGGVVSIVVTSITFPDKQPAGTFAPPKPEIKGASITGSETRTTLPFRLLGGSIVADVKVNGKGPFPFVFDTGGRIALMPSLAKALGIPPMHIRARRGRRREMAKVRSIGVGGAELKNQSVDVFDFDPRDFTGLHLKGMIGARLFEAFVTRVDYHTDQITLIQPDSFDSARAGTPIPFHLVGSIPVVNGAFDGISGNFALDTGAHSALLLMHPFVATHHLRSANPKGVVTVAGYGAAGNIRAYVTRARSFRLGPFKLPNIVTAMSLAKYGPEATSLQGAIGNGVLKHFVVTLDYANDTAYFKPIGPPLTSVGSFDRSGLVVARADNGFTVAAVTAHSAAEQAGIRPRDTIIAVDGTPATSIPIYKFRFRLRHAALGAEVDLTLRHGSRTRHVVLILRKQI